MYEQNTFYTQTQQLPVESASGTTSPNNSNSGPTAYIITAVCVVFLCVICMSVTSCMKDIVSRVMPQIMDEIMEEFEEEIVYNDEYFEHIDDEFEIEGDSFEDYFEQIFGEPFEDYFDEVGRDSDVIKDDAYEFDALSVLDLDLAIYDNTIDDMVSANAYADSDPDVKDYVRDFVLTDREMAEDLIRQLRAAARNDGNTEGRLQAARDIAESAIMEITAIEMPDAGGDVETYLSDAVDEAVARWEAVDDLIELIQENETITDQALEAVDDSIYYGTRNAAQALEDALAASAN